jgi:hypothetical protein
MTLLVSRMARKRTEGPSPGPEERRRGRPKGAGRIKSKYTLVATPEYMTWMVEFMEHAGEAEVSDTFREGVRRYAESVGFRPPPKR